MENTKIENLMCFLKDDEAGIIFSEENRLYFTGQKTTAGAIIVTKEKSYFIIDFRYYNKIKNNIGIIEPILQENLYTQINDIFKKHNISTYFIENYSLPYQTVSILKDKIKTEISLAEIFNKKINLLREIKSSWEIEKIKQAQNLTDETFSYILNKIQIGKTENEIALDMEFYSRKIGSHGVSFDFIVISGEKTSLPHGSCADKKIQKGDFLMMDFGCVIDGYRSDMTRTVAINSVSEKQKFVYNLVKKAQEKAISVLSPNITGAFADSVVRDIFEKNGYGKCFGHSLGHGVGMNIHESPNISMSETRNLKKGMVITCEPGIYIENEFGVRIEDMGIITDNGFENITKSEKNLIIL